MTVIRINKEFHFEMAHLLFNHDGACKNIHGHSYKLRVCVKGTPKQVPGNPKDGMVLDFGLLKKIVNEHIIGVYDHSLVISSVVGKESIETFQHLSTKLIIHDFQPTSENLLCHFATILQAYLPDQVALHSLRLHETASSFVEWLASDQC